MPGGRLAAGYGGRVATGNGSNSNAVGTRDVSVPEQFDLPRMPSARQGML
jgi:hypothetical protein